MVLTKNKVKTRREKNYVPPDNYDDQDQHQRKRQTQLIPIEVMMVQILEEILTEVKKINRRANG